LTSALDGSKCSDSLLGRFSPRKRDIVDIGWEVVCEPKPVWMLCVVQVGWNNEIRNWKYTEGIGSNV
jgi:hypothetical protein